MRVISPLAIEQQLVLDDAIEQVRVVPMPGADGTEAQLAVALSLAKSGLGDETEIAATVKRLRKELARKMKQMANGNYVDRAAVPKKWIILKELPLDASGEVDADALQKELNASAVPAPLMTTKQKLRRVIAETLRLPIADVGPAVSFIRLGGDSISAIEVMARALDDQVVVRVSDILRCETFTELAATATIDDGSTAGRAAETRPFSLIADLDREAFLASAREQCNLPADAPIQDAFPLTKLQEGFMALAARQPGSYISKYAFPLPKYIDAVRFRSAWEQTIQLCANMRTRMVFFNGSSYQLVVEETAHWDETLSGDVTSAVKAMNTAEMAYGSEMCQYGLARDAEGQDYFIWLIHHSIYDGWTMRLIVETLHRLYYGADVPRIYPLSGVINHVRNNLDLEADKEYWTTQLADAKRPAFPVVPSDMSATSALDGVVETVTRLETHVIPMREASGHGASLTRATILRAAWALLLARYCDSDDVSFGTTVSGRQMPVRGAQRTAGPLIASMPIRIKLDCKQPVAAFLQGVQDQASEMAAHEQYGLQSIAKLGPEAQEVCDFSSLLVIQPDKILGYPDVPGLRVLLPLSDAHFGPDQMLEGYYNYPLVLQVHLLEGQVELSVTYDSRVLSQSQVQALCYQYDHAVQQLLEADGAALGDISLAGPWDLQQALEWNSDEDPEIVSSCVHELVHQQARIRPDAPAISAWDGELSYQQLDQAATRLALHLQEEFSLAEDSLVHVCFEKSVWFFVSILAINKAGCAWVPLDPSHPEQRQRQVMQQTQAKLALTSVANRAVCADVVPHVLAVSAELDRSLRSDATLQFYMTQVSNLSLPRVSPRTASYVLFTSGSTGTPKGLVMEHESVCTSQRCIGQRVGISPSTRMLQFASYVFDACIGETILTLIAGGCVCVPSDDARMNDVTGFMNDNAVNTALLTPSFIRTLKPDDVPALRTLMLAGEAVGRDILDTWFRPGQIRLFNGWGPAETCVFSTLHEWQSVSESPRTVGRPVAGFCWIVDPSDPERLAPVGTLGEVVIQGPTILREYLADEKRTKESTWSSPSWAPRRDNPRWNRIYRSGDLCYYNPDGTIEFASRKDTQVKIRGLRVELGEVEFCVRSAVEGACQVVVDVFRTEAGATSLAAYFCFSNDTHTTNKSGSNCSDMFLPLNEDLERRVNLAVGQLAVKLPRYMVPSLFVPCRYMPVITSTKIDRNILKRYSAALSREDVAKYSLSGRKKRSPETALQIQLQQLWATVLQVPTESIGLDDSFLRIGGDSIAAIRLVALARESGIRLTVRDIFADPRLSGMSELASTEVDSDDWQAEEADIPAFSLLPEQLRNTMEALADGDDELLEFTPWAQVMLEQCSLSSVQEIEDAYPCAKLQEGFAVLGIKQPGSYIGKYVYRIPEHVDLAQFKETWARTVALSRSLRTRITFATGPSMQVVVKDEFVWDTTEDHDLTSAIDKLQKVQMPEGSRLCRYGLASDSQGRHYFLLAIHHSVYDGWTMRLVINAVNRIHMTGQAPPLTPYNRFIKYVTSVDEESSASYWKNHLEGAKQATFPAVPRALPSTEGANVTRVLRETIHLDRSADSSVTKATLLRAAWAILLAKCCDTDDICFGTSISGRNAPVQGIESMAGPLVATIPVRVRLDQSKKVSDFLLEIQTESTEAAAHEQYGLQNILKVSPDARDACEFSSLLVVQPAQLVKFSEDDSEDPVLENASAEFFGQEEVLEGYFNYPLVVQGLVHETSVELMLVYDNRSVSETRALAISRQLDHIVRQLSSGGPGVLGDITAAGPWDLKQATTWNNHDGPGTEVINACIHDFVQRHAVETPDAPAVVAWDGQLTYAQLNSAANRLAHHLVDKYHIQNDEFIHVCFEKTVWFFVAILAINKAGGAWVPLEPSHPQQRQIQVAKQTGARLALTSPTNASICRPLVSQVLQVSADLDRALSDDAVGHSLQPPQRNTTPSNAAYVLFTSGSTGVPKGLVMEHRSVCTSQIAIGKRVSMHRGARMLQFASYVFDACIGEAVMSLIAGACVCVPSEEIRMDTFRLAEFMRETGVTWALLTPAFIRTIRPADVPGLRVLMLAGEAVGRDILETWFGKVDRLFNGWGPAETCVFSTLHEWKSADESPLTIGRPVGGFCWVVDPTDPSRLAPTGCMGEIVIQGPTVLREYLSSPELTAKFVVEDLPDWAPRRSAASWRRFYKSGDLGFYNADGTLEFAGRKDTQVKIRGLRVELGEVEQHIRELLQPIQHVIVDVHSAGDVKNLVAFFSFDEGSSSSGDDVFMPLTPALEQRMTALLGQLAIRLPRYMVPSLFIPCRNRKKNPPRTPNEVCLRDLWASILKVEAESIGRDDSFLRIGGDSIAAIRLVSLAREAGLELRVQHVFDDPRLSAVSGKAVVIGEQDDGASKPIAPFSLLEEAQRSMIDNQAASFRAQCGLPSNIVVEDAYPCSKLQEGLMALSEKNPGTYVVRNAYRLPATVEINRFKAAWEHTVSVCTNLRTRIVYHGDRHLQIVGGNDNEWDSLPESGLAEALRLSRAAKMSYGSRLCRYSLAAADDGTYCFVLTFHHAINDGWTIRLMMDVLQRSYHNLNPMTPEPYSRFIEYVKGMDHDDAAISYWTEELRGASCASFPAQAAVGTESSSRSYNAVVDFPASDRFSSATKATVLRAAWAVLLARYCDTDDLCFGTTVSGRQAPVRNADTITGPLVATVPVRIRLDKEQSVADYLQSVQQQASDMVPYEQFGLQSISKLGAEFEAACTFSSLFAVQPAEQLAEPGQDAAVVPANADFFGSDEQLQGYFNYPLVVQGLLYEDRVELYFIYNTSALTEHQVEALSNQFNHVVGQLLLGDGAARMGSVSVAGPWDLQKALSWNTETPELVRDTLHGLFRRQAELTPDREAVYSWDGRFSYAEIDDYSTRLATHLISLGVRPNAKIPICFEKSAWAIVAMLAILKAGCAFVPLDGAHPVQRRRAIVSDLSAPVAVVSSSMVRSNLSLGPPLVSVFPEFVKALPLSTRALRPISAASPEVAYIIFTSGSTGKPKGIVVEHNAICASVMAQGKAVGMADGEECRFLQFGNYVFDSCITEIFTCFAYGGTTCVPSDAQRLSDVAGFITSARVTMALLTPSFASTFGPADVPTLKTLMLGGEPATRDVVRAWHGSLRLMNIYGPAESCVFCTAHDYRSPDGLPTTIGRGFSNRCWVVEPEGEGLTPVGCVGELVVEGDALARGYLNDAARTKESFVDTRDLAWLPRIFRDVVGVEGQRAYRTGDLVRQDFDGSLVYIGRRDVQVKLRGQRIELAEIDYHIKELLPGVSQVAADIIQQESGEVLVAYLSFNDIKTKSTAQDNNVLPMNDDLKQKLATLSDNLRDRLPAYMLPSLFIPLHRIPMFLASMKVDRKSLRAVGSSLSAKQLASLSLDSRAKAEPETEMEFRLRDVWARVLNVDAADIGRHDSFLRIGGDSLNAIKLVSLARQSGIVLTAAAIFQDSRLSHLASIATATEAEAEDTARLEPFNLISAEDKAHVMAEVSKAVGGNTNIEDIYPCTKLQEGLMALSVKQPGSYMATFTYTLSASVDRNRLKQAWGATVASCGNLRTRIVLSAGSSYQVILKDDITWDRAVSEESMTYGSRLSRYALVGDSFVLTLHHAIYDGWAFQLVMETLKSHYYENTAPELPSYADFVRLTTTRSDQGASRKFWEEQLRDAKRATFPSTPSSNTQLLADPSKPRTECVRRTATLPRSSTSHITKATVLRAAWAMLLARYSDSEDICFATTVSGRQAAVAGVDKMAGPTIATVPSRIRLDGSRSVEQFLNAMQEQATVTIAHEQFGLQDISKINNDIKDACDFTSLLVIQPEQTVQFAGNNSEPILIEAGDQDLAASAQDGHFNYPLVMQGAISDDEVHLLAVYDSSVLAESQMSSLCEQFSHIAQQLIKFQDDKTFLKDISIAGPSDLQQAIAWNNKDTEAELIDECLHRLIEERARHSPNAPAVYAWDATFTYSELNGAANRLAHHLVAQGVRPDDFVHVYFDKSAWYVVAILAINKAGGAWAPLDPSQPLERQRQTVSQTRSRLILTSPSHAATCRSLVETVVEVSPALDYNLIVQRMPSFDTTLAGPDVAVTPAGAAYVLFTSGSTGTPKGLVMEHRSACTSQLAIGKRLRADSNVRMLQFASCVFDLSVGEIFGALLHGGCVCVPSEEAKMGDLASFIRAANVNWAILTPSYARTMRPDQFPGLELLILAGEAVGRDNLEAWFGKLRLVNGWGPAETCVFSAIHEWTSLDESPVTIGRPVGGYGYVVDPADPYKMAPVGCVGELVIQGPTIMREYLSDPERTAASAVPAAEWAPRGKSPRWSRFYKSGDLCRYNADGTIEYIGRKDTQVKIRGLRVELGEVEHAIRTHLDGVGQVAVDVLRTDGAVRLAAFFTMEDDVSKAEALTAGPGLFLPLTAHLERRVGDLVGVLGVSLPRYMVPALFVPCSRMPFVTSTKLDRSLLRKLALELSKEQISRYGLSSSVKRAPETAKETKLQQVWAKVLGISSDDIGRDDSFLRIGGDSIGAIRLVTLAREVGLALTVKNIFNDPRLSAMSATAVEVEPLEEDANLQQGGSTIAPFQLLDEEVREMIQSGDDVRKTYGLTETDVVEDAYPCTQLQEGLLAIGERQPGSYVLKTVYKLPENVDLPRFKAAWEHVVDLCANLRTRVAIVKGQAIQLTVQDDVFWEVDGRTDDNLQSVLNGMTDARMSYGTRLCRYAITQADGSHYFALFMHHSISDGWTMRIVMEALMDTYNEVETLPLPSFAGFVAHANQLDKEIETEYWSEQLQGAQRAAFPASSPTKSGATKSMSTAIDFPSSTSTSITKATIIRAAWVVVLARYSDTDDITFGSTVSGRQSSIPGLQRMAGAAVATIPVRVKLDATKSVSQFLRAVQDQAVDMIPHEQYGLRQISETSPEAKEVCDFSSLLVVQPAAELEPPAGSLLTPVDLATITGEPDAEFQDYFNYPLVVQGRVSADGGVGLLLVYDSGLFEEAQMEALSAQFNHVVQQLLANDKTAGSLGNISVSGPWDSQKVMQWNGCPPKLVDTCIQDL
ncbi:NRPS protein, partial [Colletotrichum musicola]